MTILPSAPVDAESPAGSPGPAAERALRVVLADDHPILRAGLRLLIDAQPDMCVVAEASDGGSAVQRCLEHRPDVVVLDVAMPVVSGASAAERLRAECPETAVLALSAHDDGAHVQAMLAAGARGYVAKSSPPNDLVRAVRMVASGEVYLDGAVASSVVDQAVRGRGAGGPTPALSGREAAALERIALGHTMKEIAAELNVAVRTVETYRARAMEKLGLHTRADVIRYAVERGWLGRR